ncbi:mandelate racemase/muconate lactonizing enzyme family protein [Membranihabitans marinus]|uniref:mandelate racemase/muconate lactonizing enzyme family protein n=1 Tax=Membranihabitans marinus TaxID=1227546 RepID=UPI001F45FE88|nr:mandelate racemase/muconate lactonizing enzyme family protein [Membranihabitans marinus]
MKIESIDFFYLSMPEVEDIGDGSQDSVLVRVRGGGLEGWGECEASPLPTIASYVCPMSHSACKPVKYAVEGMELKSIADIQKVTQKVHEHSFDLLQADHTLSGIDIALWDLLGKYLEVPVYELLGYKKSYPKLPYASMLFGDTPAETYAKARTGRSQGFKAVKFGWGPIGKGSAQLDTEHFRAAREGLGVENYLMVDIGTVWHDDVEKAKERVAALKSIDVYWLEEPFANMALGAYQALSKYNIPLAAGEGCNNYLQASAMMEYAGLEFVQIDTGRVGGITSAKRIAEDTEKRKLTYVNHTFTSHLALSASLQSYAGIEKDIITEFPFEAKSLCEEMTVSKIQPNTDGWITLPEQPGLGVEINKKGLEKYIVDTEIKVKGNVIYQSPDF